MEAGAGSASPARNWADIQDDDDFVFGEEVEVDRPDGLKEKIHYFTNDQGDTVKTTRVIREIREVTRINRAVYERLKWSKLPKLGDQELDDENVCAMDETEYNFEYPKTGAYREDMEDDDVSGGIGGDSTIVPLRPDIKRKFMALARAMGEENPKKVEEPAAAEKEDEPTAQKIWKAPWQKRAEQGLPPPRAMDDQAQRDECTVRVTNLSEDVKEKDLMDLFGSVGMIHRIFLARHKETGGSKGFAFITYKRKEDAQKAISTLHRHGYDNLLLTVETAKQTNRQRDGEQQRHGGGYGQH